MRIHPGYLCLCAGLAAGCENPHPSLASVSPGQAYSGQDVRLTIMGDNFIPTTILDPDQGRRIATSDGFRIRIGDGTSWWQLDDVAWLATTQITASFAGSMAEGFAPGALDVELVDPRGERAVLTHGFVELGPDLIPPVVTFDSPTADTMLAPGMLLRGHFNAADVAPGRLSALDWTYYENDSPVADSGGDCQIPSGVLGAGCGFQAQISGRLRGDDVVKIVARAYDDADPANVGAASLSFVLHPQPALEGVTPPSGGTMGGTDVVIRGSGFIPGSTVTINGVPLFPDGGLYVDPSTISGHIPAARKPDEESMVPVLVHTAFGDSKLAAGFHYLPSPQIQAITPTSAPAGAKITISGSHFSDQTCVCFGTTLATATRVCQPDFLSRTDTMIALNAPAGHGKATVWAYDDNLGYTELPKAFTWSSP
jgi:hypothetical protein